VLLAFANTTIDGFRFQVASFWSRQREKPSITSRKVSKITSFIYLDLCYLFVDSTSAVPESCPSDVPPVVPASESALPQ
jgi:hypothetical protein